MVELLINCLDTIAPLPEVGSLFNDVSLLVGFVSLQLKIKTENKF